MDAESLKAPDTRGRPLVIEGAGGLMVPLTRDTLYIDVFERWQLPVVLCASTAPGTVNHSLLSIETLRKRQTAIPGIVFIGERNAEVQSAVCDITRVRWLGRLPCIFPLTSCML